MRARTSRGDFVSRFEGAIAACRQPREVVEVPLVGDSAVANVQVSGAGVGFGEGSFLQDGRTEESLFAERNKSEAETALRLDDRVDEKPGFRKKPGFFASSSLAPDRTFIRS